jgi:hypothetical protein
MKAFSHDRRAPEPIASPPGTDDAPATAPTGDLHTLQPPEDTSPPGTDAGDLPEPPASTPADDDMGDVPLSYKKVPTSYVHGEGDDQGALPEPEDPSGFAIRQPAEVGLT